LNWLILNSSFDSASLVFGTITARPLSPGKVGCGFRTANNCQLSTKTSDDQVITGHTGNKSSIDVVAFLVPGVFVFSGALRAQASAIIWVEGSTKMATHTFYEDNLLNLNIGLDGVVFSVEQ